MLPLPPDRPNGMITVVTNEPPPPTASTEPPRDLSDIRRRIDDVDRRLVLLLAERARLVDAVVAYKRSRHMAVVDRGREDAMIARIGRTAIEAGLDARVAQQVLRTIIDGFTLLEVEVLGPDP